MLWVARKIDQVNEAVARFVRWGLLANALLIAANPITRKLFSIALSTADDLQWHFFAAVVLLMAAYTFQRDEHVRIDLFAQRLGDRGLAWLDLLGINHHSAPRVRFDGVDNTVTISCLTSLRRNTC